MVCVLLSLFVSFGFFFFNDTATTEIYTLSLHDALPIFAGRDLAQITRRKVPYYRRNIGMVFQDFKLLPNRTVYDNVAYALQVTGSGRRETREKAPDILRLTGLS